MLVRKFYSTYGRNDTKQAEMPFFGRVPSRQENF